jgi:HD-GYP domain-containing protein (c-di-GMP phosphodiesterase class II)
MDTVESLYTRLEQLNDIGTSLSGEHDIDRLLEKILLAVKGITHADGGTLYTVAPDGRHLIFRIVRTDSLGIAYGGQAGAPMPSHFKDLPLYLEDGLPNDHMVAAHVALSGETANIRDAYEEKRFDFSGTRRFDAATGYRSTSFLTVPMKNHEGEVIGVLQLLNALDPETKAVRPFTPGDQRLAESLGSQAAVALTNRQLIAQLETLFESFVQLIDTAIDEKSPYTGGHCARVPELTMLLAEAVNGTTEGPLAGFTLTDKDRYELRIAALLHDCGKVTTPVHVVDKATKLETIFDRIEMVATRFAVLKAQAQAEMWRVVAGGEPQAAAQERFDAQCRQMDEDLAFLRQANRGSERMDDAAVERVREMAQRYRWVDEQGRTQPLLSDNEVENLTIRAGTLTAAEREVINHHIVATIQMLEKLPWPKHLARVPEYAGGHHERMDGKGYPKGLRREQMSLQARMMGIADIFEALTAADRPYKAPMKLSQALKIMQNFKDNGHIDPICTTCLWRSRCRRSTRSGFWRRASGTVKALAGWQAGAGGGSQAGGWRGWLIWSTGRGIAWSARAPRPAP